MASKVTDEVCPDCGKRVSAGRRNCKTCRNMYQRAYNRARPDVARRIEQRGQREAEARANPVEIPPEEELPVWTLERLGQVSLNTLGFLLTHPETPAGEKRLIASMGIKLLKVKPPEPVVEPVWLKAVGEMP